MTWEGAVTLGIALLGACLGMLNTWHSLNRDKLKLRVRPVSVVTFPPGPYDYGIEVINLSLFAVTVTEVGFTLDSNSAERGDRALLLDAQPVDGGPWPRRLEPRTGVTTYFNSSGISEPRRIRRAYAKTACDEYAYGYTPAVQGLRSA